MTALFNHWNEKQWIVDVTREKIIHEGILFHSMLLSCLPKYTFIVVLITSSLFMLVNCFFVYAMNNISHWAVSKDKDITEQLEPEECILVSLLYCSTCSQWYASVPFLLPNEDAVQINADVLCLHHCTNLCCVFTSMHMHTFLYAVCGYNSPTRVTTVNIWGKQRCQITCNISWKHYRSSFCCKHSAPL